MAETTTEIKDPQPDANYKDTVESILVAFILAFIFRAFVVEAFVIPTGSMAPTLYGAHMRMTCPDCGYTFDVGYRGPRSDNSDEIDIPNEINRPANIHCPNCAFDFPSQDALGHAIDQPLRFGDRILVLKYLYLFDKPRRWDVVVFKSPSEEHHVAEDPEYGQNYIKRLIATPTESAVILDGDIYIGPSNAQGVEETPGGFKVADDADKFIIQRKPMFVQDRLWRIVADSDFVPQGHVTSRTTTWHQPWQISDGDGWKIPPGGQTRIFNFDNGKNASTLFFNPDANRDINSLTDWISYDQLDDVTRSRPWVSDLKLSCFYTRKRGDGAFRLYLTKSDQCFVAEFVPGKVSLYRAKILAQSDEFSGQGFEMGPMSLIDSKSLAGLEADAPIQIDFMNYDYHVVLRVNGNEVLSTPLESYKPEVKILWNRALASVHDSMARPEIRISADKQSCSVEHLSLWHDIYYGNRNPQMGGQAFWASPQRVMHLKPDEYFVLGDNSLISGDARYWNDPIQLPREGLPYTEGGRVPESFMLGKAFFVYWPAGYRLPYVPKNIVPDFGEMRFIH